MKEILVPQPLCSFCRKESTYAGICYFSLRFRIFFNQYLKNAETQVFFMLQLQMEYDNILSAGNKCIYQTYILKKTEWRERRL